jgi:hypothetical protein
MEVRSPNPEYTGAGPHGVAFVNGVGFCYSAVAIDWFRRKGYELLDEPQFDTPDVTKAASGKGGTDSRDVIPAVPSEDASESKLLTQEERRTRYGIGVGTLLPEGHSITGAPAIDAGLPQLSREQRAKLRDYLEETEEARVEAAHDELDGSGNVRTADDIAEDGPTVTPPPAPSGNFDSMSTADLRKAAQAANIQGRTTMNQAQLRDALKAADQKSNA